MNLHPAAAIVGGLVLGALTWWWLARDAAGDDAASGPAPASVAEADIQGIWLYRWRDDAGVLQITDTPPKGRPFERIDRQPRAGIEVDGTR